MTTGDSLVFLAITGAIIFAVYKIHKTSKWKILLKVLGIIIAVGCLIAATTYAYFEYQNRPQITTQLGKLKLGMKPVEVTLELGKPDNETEENDVLRYSYTSTYSSYSVVFNKENSEYRADIICTEDYSNEVFGIGVYDSEEDVIKKLGSPSTESISEDGLAKFISYEQWKVSFNIQKGSVEMVCISESGKVGYVEEYADQETASSTDVTKEKVEEQPKEETETLFKTIYYIGCDEFSCSIPRASGLPYDTTCTWNYSGGNGVIPYKEVTEGDHTISWNSMLYDLKVQCVDTQGNLYIGTEGLQRPL